MGTKSVRRQMQKDIKLLRNSIQEFRDGLIPFEEEEFKLLSSLPVSKTSKKAGSVLSKGVFSTIYQEPLIAFSMKHNRKDNTILVLAESDSNEYRLMYSQEGTEAYVNDQYLGTINEEIQFLPTGSQKVFAEIQLSDNNKYARVLINKKDTAHINLENKSLSETERVFSLFHDFKHEDSDEMIILTLYYLLIEDKAA